MAHKLILLVEDDDVEAELMRVALGKNGVTADVRRARDGEEALDVLFSPDARGNAFPTVVFLDLNLPRVSGIEVLKRIRSDDSLRTLPVVVLSSSTLHEDIDNAYLSGANSYVRKPLNFAEFSRAVKQLTSYWLGLNESAPLVEHSLQEKKWPQNFSTAPSLALRSKPSTSSATSSSRPPNIPSSAKT